MKLHWFGTLGVLLAAVLAAGLIAAASAGATPVTVNLRIEGTSGTLYEGPITTDGKMVTTHTGGTHACDGTQGSGNANTPGGTPTTALDDAAHATGFTWDGNYDSGFGDFLVERVGTDGQVGVFGSSFWSVSVNRVALQVGGCQFRVQNGDDVLWDWTVFGDPNLQLTAPSQAKTGTPVTVKVQQYDDSGALSPAVGASVDGQPTDSSGSATLTFSSAGMQHFKATLSGANRSNAADICVYATSASECGPPPTTPASPTGTHDRVAPTLGLKGIKNHKHYRRHHGPRTLAGTASDAGGLFQVYFRLRRFADGGCRWYSSKRAEFTNLKRHCRARFQRVGAKTSWSYLLPTRLSKGAYMLETKAIDKSFNASTTRVKFTVAG